MKLGFLCMYLDIIEVKIILDYFKQVWSDMPE